MQGEAAQAIASSGHDYLRGPSYSPKPKLGGERLHLLPSAAARRSESN